MSNTDDAEYPDEFEQSPPTQSWEEDIDSYLLHVRRYDKNDVLIGSQYFMLVTDDEADSHIITSILLPTDREPSVRV